VKPRASPLWRLLGNSRYISSMFYHVDCTLIVVVDVDEVVVVEGDIDVDAYATIDSACG